MLNIIDIKIVCGVMNTQLYIVEVLPFFGELENEYMKKLLKIALVSVASLVLIGVAMLLIFGRDSHRTLSGSIPEQINQYLMKKDFQGSVVVVQKGSVLFEKGYGMAAPNVPNTPSTLYQIASLSKTFTAVAIMQLGEKQMLEIDGSIEKYFPEFPNADSITVGHLLSHSSGIPDYLHPDFEFDYGKSWEPEEIVNVVRDTDLLFEPGKSFQYSNSGYVMLGLIIEQVSGQSYDDYIMEHIFIPSGMHNSMFDIPEGMAVAKGHIKGKEGPVMDNSAAYAAGDILSTAEDLALFDHALRNHVLITEDTDALMAKKHASKFPYQYGYGWYTQDVMGHHAVGHSGGYPSGFRHYVARLLDEDITVIVLSNELSINSKSINRNLTSIILQKPIWIWEELL
ncbi:serine hydrolase domain-containing protein [Lederbergia panacisoli]|uniref:serine hydrolase domain-containing protein n=1 Tax=Lederbergia panacisoli TaxID=1255251 RepID=UPI00214BCC56|nr:serine hydrolase domain-containing protein [Lederbergia panacisoli]MCR2823638.1 beta-lactamase family protein [Lederbergia panacisoli]